MKLLFPLLRSEQRWQVKLEGVIHLTGYLVHPLMLLVMLLTLPMSFSRSWVLAVAPWLMVAAAGPPLLYTVAQVTEKNGGCRRLPFLPLLVLLGMGLALSNTVAIIKAVLRTPQGFERTPKYALHRPDDTWVSSVYALRGDGLVWGEMALALYAVALLATPGIHWGFAPWLLLYAGGFGYVAGLNLFQTHQHRRWLARQPISTASRSVRTL
jgi:hypothetical protein